MQNVKTVARRAGLGIAVAGVATAATIAPASAYAEISGAATSTPVNTANTSTATTSTGFDYAAAQAAGWNYSWVIDANGVTHYTYGNGATSSSAPAAHSGSYASATSQSSNSYAAPAAQPQSQSAGVSTQSVTNVSGIAATAMQGQGSGYMWGGNNYGAWDCSGFVKWVYAQHGIELPRLAAAQGAAGTPTANPKPGDLVVQNGGSHIGIYLGNGQMISALNPTQGTIVHPVSAMGVDYYATFS